jgi:hypothetical protein
LTVFTSPINIPIITPTTRVVIKKADLTGKYWFICTGLRIDRRSGVDFGEIIFR